MPRITNLFNEKIYIFSRQQEVYESEKVLIEKIFLEKDLGQIQQIDFIDANINNDIFSVKTSLGRFCIKLSLDKNASNFQKEFNILQKNVNKKISAYAVAHGLDNSVEYLITAHLPMPNIASAGVASVVEQDYSIPFFLNQLSQFETIDGISSMSSYLDHYLNFDIFKVPDVEIDWLENHGKFLKLMNYVMEISISPQC